MKRLSSLVLLVGLSSLSVIACESADDDNDSAEGGFTSVSNAPCNNELADQCGADCVNDSECADGLFCNGSSCTADCSAAGEQCMGTCDSRGRCSGTLTSTGPTAPSSEDPNGFIASTPNNSNAGAGGASSTATLTADEACGSGTLSADLKPVNMFIMFDRSLSMADDNKWAQATEALSAFIADPIAAELGVALRFFGDEQCNENDCSVGACREPLVALDTLLAASGAADPQEQRLLDAIEAADPDYRGTPIHSALGGALDWAQEYQAANVDQTTVVVLVTDGEPRGCNENINDIAQLAQDAFDASGVRTYAVGLDGSNPAQMNAIAAAGQTTQGYLIGGTGDAAAELVTALNDIRGRSLACEFAVPPTEGGVNPSEVNVLFSSGGTGQQSFVPVSSAAECGTQTGWYYDNPSDPENIYLCEASCELALATADAELEVLLGCPSGDVPPGLLR